MDDIIDTADGHVCGACLVGLINGDLSGHDDLHEEADVDRWYRAAEAAGLADVTTADDYEGEFSWRGCDVCAAMTGERLGATVYGVVCL